MDRKDAGIIVLVILLLSPLAYTIGIELPKIQNPGIGGGVGPTTEPNQSGCSWIVSNPGLTYSVTKGNGIGDVKTYSLAVDALQYAVDLGGLVCVTAGTYTFTKILNVKSNLELAGEYGKTIFTADTMPRVPGGVWPNNALINSTGNIINLSIHDLVLDNPSYWTADSWNSGTPAVNPAADTCCDFTILLSGGTNQNVQLYNLIFHGCGSCILTSTGTNAASATGISRNLNIHDNIFYEANGAMVVRSCGSVSYNTIISNIYVDRWSDGILDAVAYNCEFAGHVGDFQTFIVNNVVGFNGQTGGFGFEACCTAGQTARFRGLSVSGVSLEYNRTLTSTGRIAVLVKQAGGGDITDFSFSNMMFNNTDRGFFITGIGASGGGGVIDGFVMNQVYDKAIHVENSNPASVLVTNGIVFLKNLPNIYGIYLQANINIVSGFFFKDLWFQNGAQQPVVYETLLGSSQSITQIVFVNIIYGVANFTFLQGTSLGGFQWYGGTPLEAGSYSSPISLSTTLAGASTQTANQIWARVISGTVLSAGVNIFYVNNTIFGILFFGGVYPIMVSLWSPANIAVPFTVLAYDNSTVTGTYKMIVVKVIVSAGLTLSGDLIFVLDVRQD